MSETNCRHNGEIDGDSKAMPNRGTTSGVTTTYGADVGPKATNSRPLSGTDSDPMDMDKTPDSCCRS